MAVVENRFVCDLSKPVQAQALKGNVFSLDNLGSRISVLIYENGQPATISGSVTANCILPDGSTVNVNGGLTTENGGSKAYVDIPQSCILIPGILKIAIKCTSSSVITTLAAIVANVYMTKTDNVITPSQQIIADWNAEISAAIATQNAAIANQDTKINDLKSALLFNPSEAILTNVVEHGGLSTSDGSQTVDPKRLRTGLIDVSNDNYLSAIVKQGFRIGVLYYNADGTYAGSSTTYGNIQASTNQVNVTGYSKIRAVIINDNATSGYVMPYEEIQNTYLFRNVAFQAYDCALTGYYFEYDASGIYFKYTDYIYIRGSIEYQLPQIGNTGITLVTSPFGVTDCIYVSHGKTLAFNTATLSVSVINMSALKEYSTYIPLLNINRIGAHDGCIGGLLSNFIENHGIYFANANNSMTWTYENEPYFEYTDGSGVYFTTSGKTFLRGFDTSVSSNMTWANMSALPFVDSTSLETSPLGKTNCLHIPHNYSLIYVPYVKKLKLVANDDLWKYPCAILVYRVITNKGHEIIAEGIGLCTVDEYENDLLTTKRSVFADFDAAFNSTSAEAESFMFFSDPHVAGSSNYFDNDFFNKFIDELQFGYENTPTSFIVDGGDWLNFGDYQSTACVKLGLIDGNMRKRFPNYYPVNGNHDTNYQGVVSASDSSRGDLSLNTMTNLRFRENGYKAYYSFDGPSSKNYVFDSGLDWGSEGMNSYRWEQVDWFANKLIEDDDPHGIVWVHIAFLDYETLDPTDISALMTNIGTVIQAYNSRSEVTLNGHRYDYRRETIELSGKVWFIMCGHIHADLKGTIGGIPVVAVPNTRNGGKVTYDLGIADFGNNKLKLFRVGTGTNDEITI